MQQGKTLTISEDGVTLVSAEISHESTNLVAPGVEEYKIQAHVHFDERLTIKPGQIITFADGDVIIDQSRYMLSPIEIYPGDTTTFTYWQKATDSAEAPKRSFWGRMMRRG